MVEVKKGEWKLKQRFRGIPRKKGMGKKARK
mgnify:FL=1